MAKLPKVIKAIGNVGKTGSKKGKQGEKIAKSSQAKQIKARDKGESGSKTQTFNSNMIRHYVRDIEIRTGRSIPRNQREKLKEALRSKEYKKLTPEQTRKHRLEFDRVKEKIIREWEENTGQTWPRYSEDVISDKTGWVIRRKGTRYDAHHIIENTFDGEHEWWNIHPAKFPDEHQRGIHAKESPASEIFGGGKK